MNEFFASKTVLPVLIFMLVSLILYGTLFWVLGLEQFDATNRSVDTVRIIE